MELKTKLQVLADAAKYDASCASSGSRRATPQGGIGNTRGIGICHSYTPDGRCVSLLKLLLTNYCIYDCQYCVNRISSDIPRAKFEVSEVVYLTMAFYKRNYIEGLFLSSGIVKNPDHTMERLVEVARTLRVEHRFGGYIHLKTIPHADAALIEQAGRYADRLSVNIELPTSKDLGNLAPQKSMPSIESAMGHIQEKISEHGAPTKTSRRFTPAGQSTQMIVGATDTPDGTILLTASHLYKHYKLRRVYYSAFSPIPSPDARLPAKAPPLVREHRLYQADWLTRFYGFTANEIVNVCENLSLEHDPKLGWALKHRQLFPIDINRAAKELLLRVPGLGVRNVMRILQTRKIRPLRIDDLKRLRVPLKKTLPFIITPEGASTAKRWLDSLQLSKHLVQPEQLTLFDAGVSARTGEL